MADEGVRAFAPVHPLALSAAPDGSWIAVVEPPAVTIVDPVTAAVHAEVGLAVDAECDVAWAGNPSRLVVVQRHADHTIVHLVDIQAAPRPLGEVRIDRPVHALASGLTHALLVSDRGSVVVGVTGDKLAIGEFPSRAVPTAAGAFGPHHVIVAAGGVLEEWDTHARQARRRFRLPRPQYVRTVGGTERLLWSVSQADPTRIETFPLINRGQPRLHELPEPIASIAGHPKVELLIWIGAESGQARILDLEGRGRDRELGEPGATLCALVAGRQLSAVLAAPDRFLAIEVIDSRGVDARRPSAVVSVTDPELGDIGLPPPTSIMPDLGDLDTPAALATDAVDRAAAAADRIAAIGEGEAAPVTASELAHRLAGWRATAGPPAPSPYVAAAPVATARPGPRPALARSWREVLVDWTRTALSGTAPAPPRGSPLDELTRRLGLDDALEPGVALLYGAHLLGHDGVAPADLARAVRSWDEALGTGELARRGVARWRRSRVRLAPPVRDALDDRPPRTGTLIGSAATAPTLITPCAVRVASGVAADAAAGLIARAGGAYLAVAAGADPADALLEARARGAIALTEDPTVALGDGIARVIGPGVDAGDLAVIEVDAGGEVPS